MSSETTYKCDKCKKVVEDSKALRSLVIGHKAINSYSSSLVEDISVELCIDCCAKLGLVKKVIDGNKIVEETQTIGDRLYDVIADVVNDLGIQTEY